MQENKYVFMLAFAMGCSSSAQPFDSMPDPGTGTDVSTPDPSAPDPCRDSDQCPSSGDPIPPGAGDPDAPHIGSALVTIAYAGFYASASSASALVDIPPHGGVADDSLHPY